MEEFAKLLVTLVTGVALVLVTQGVTHFLQRSRTIRDKLSERYTELVGVAVEAIEAAKSIEAAFALRRFTRLALGFSKKLENLQACVALYVAHYNSCRRHCTLRMTPAMKAKVAGHPWTLEELVTEAVHYDKTEVVS
jgi:hypothetical protein